MNKNMLKVQKAYKNEQDFKIVGLMVNPENDTVELLSKYSENFQAIPGKWYYLTGKKKPIYILLREGFKLGTEDVPPAERGTQTTSFTAKSSYIRSRCMNNTHLVSIKKTGEDQSSHS